MQHLVFLSLTLCVCCADKLENMYVFGFARCHNCWEVPVLELRVKGGVWVSALAVFFLAVVVVYMFVCIRV